jgi:hypothetical protein
MICREITRELVPVSHLCAFLCLVVWQSSFPLPSFTPFTGHKILSALTAIVKDCVAMHLGVLVLCNESPMGGEATGSLTTGPSIGSVIWLPNNIKRWLGTCFKWMRLWGNRCTTTNCTQYTFIRTGPLIWWILPNVVILNFQVCVAFWIVTGGQ